MQARKMQRSRDNTASKQTLSEFLVSPSPTLTEPVFLPLSQRLRKEIQIHSYCSSYPSSVDSWKARCAWGEQSPLRWTRPEWKRRWKKIRHRCCGDRAFQPSTLPRCRCYCCYYWNSWLSCEYRTRAIGERLLETACCRSLKGFAHVLLGWSRLPLFHHLWKQ